MQVFFRTRSAVAKAVQRLTAPPPGDEDPRLLVTVAFFGDGSFGCSYRGTPSSHYRQVREALRECCTCVVVNTPEQGTSKVSSRAAPLRYNVEGVMLDWAD